MILILSTMNSLFLLWFFTQIYSRCIRPAFQGCTLHFFIVSRAKQGTFETKFRSQQVQINENRKNRTKIDASSTFTYFRAIQDKRGILSLTKFNLIITNKGDRMKQASSRSRLSIQTCGTVHHYSSSVLANASVSHGLMKTKAK